ncbi:MAG TPA: hypothetical protein VLC53_05065 [Myxococcota bacterium]|jgi:hypothetical protein|nr:hypothetical protein [Myxococcota bacterium]
MQGTPRPPPRRPRPAPATFRPEFTLLLLYFFGLFLLFALLMALPALLEALRELPPGDGPLTTEERALAAETAREALRGRVPYAVIAALLVLAVGVWTRSLPGLRRRP